MRPIARFFVGALLIGAFIIPQVSSASMTNDEIRTQIESLLLQVKTMRAQLPQSGTASSSSPMIACRDLRRNLQFGDRGEEVKLLQEMLAKAGYSPDTDGTFGDETGAAVSGFQQEYKNELLSPIGLKAPTGFVGNLTRAKLNALCKERPPVTANLVCAQPPMPVCPEGRACVQLFPAPQTYPSEEKAKAVGATILHKGPCTEAENPNPNPTPSCRPIGRNLSPGNTGEEVKTLQTFLTEQGFPVETTGYFGKITSSAVARFQEKHKDEVLAPAGLATSTGIVGNLTRTKINKICPTPPPTTGNEVCALPQAPLCPQGGGGTVSSCPEAVPTTYPSEEAANKAMAKIIHKGACKPTVPFTDEELNDLRKWKTPPMEVSVPPTTATNTATTTQGGGTSN